MPISIVVLPSYQPDEHLPRFVTKLIDAGFERVVVVDDGSDVSCLPFFDACAGRGARVIRHSVNQGKGRALKTGINQAMLLWPGEPVISADGDGQSSVADISRMDDALAKHPETLVIGARTVSDMPGRSRVGNTITCAVYALTTGLFLRDTQTGLRGFPPSALPRLFAIPGERFEWEMNVLMRLGQLGVRAVQLPIETIYIDGNRRSHFHAVRDSARVYKAILLSKGRDAASFALGLIMAALLAGALPAWAAAGVGQVAHMTLRKPRAAHPITLLSAFVFPPALASALCSWTFWPPALCLALSNLFCLIAYELFFSRKLTEVS